MDELKDLVVARSRFKKGGSSVEQPQPQPIEEPDHVVATSAPQSHGTAGDLRRTTFKISDADLEMFYDICREDCSTTQQAVFDALLIMFRERDEGLLKRLKELTARRQLEGRRGPRPQRRA